MTLSGTPNSKSTAELRLGPTRWSGSAGHDAHRPHRRQAGTPADRRRVPGQSYSPRRSPSSARRTRSPTTEATSGRAVSGCAGRPALLRCEPTRQPEQRNTGAAMASPGMATASAPTAQESPHGSHPSRRRDTRMWFPGGRAPSACKRRRSPAPSRRKQCRIALSPHQNCHQKSDGQTGRRDKSTDAQRHPLASFQPKRPAHSKRLRGACQSAWMEVRRARAQDTEAMARGDRHNQS